MTRNPSSAQTLPRSLACILPPRNIMKLLDPPTRPALLLLFAPLLLLLLLLLLLYLPKLLLKLLAKLKARSKHASVAQRLR